MKTPQELMDMMGAGRAQKTLEAQCQWNERLAPLGEGASEYTIEVTGSYDPHPETQIYVVRANTEYAAKKMAEYKSDFDEIDEVKIVKSTQ